jgi:hypothetical protein
MTPRELQTKWGISRTLMPAILGKGYRRIDDYLAGSCAIPDSVRSQCWLLDFYLSNGGSVPDFITLQIRNYCGN